MLTQLKYRVVNNYSMYCYCNVQHLGTKYIAFQLDRIIIAYLIELITPSFSFNFFPLVESHYDNKIIIHIMSALGLLGIVYHTRIYQNKK